MKKTSFSALTFIELIFVIIILSVLTAMTFPKLKKSAAKLELNFTIGQLKSFMSYTSQQSVNEGRMIILMIDIPERKYWTQIETGTKLSETYKIPDAISVETENKEIHFYPDGTIDKVSINLSVNDGKKSTLTTKGVFSGVKTE